MERTSVCVCVGGRCRDELRGFVRVAASAEGHVKRTSRNNASHVRGGSLMSLSTPLFCDDHRWRLWPGDHLPAAWEKAEANFVTTSNSIDMETQCPVVPSALFLGWVSRAVLFEHVAATQPKRLEAEGVVQWGRADAHILTAQLIAEKTAERGKQVWFLEVDLADTFGALAGPKLWRILHEKMGHAGALAMMNTICSHSLIPHWLGLTRDAVSVHEGCRQGAPESPPLWNVMLDEVMAPVLRAWQQEGRGDYLLAFADNGGGRRSLTLADSAPMCKRLGYADDYVSGM